MAEHYDSGRSLYLGRDDDGRVKELRPADRSRSTSQQLPQRAAAEFLIDHADRLDIDPSWLTGEALPGATDGPGDAVTADGIELRYAGEKYQFDTTTVAFQQTWRGLEVWRSGVTVTMRTGPARVATVANNTWRQIDVDLPRSPVLKRAVAGERGLMSAAVGTTLTARASRTAKATDGRRAAEMGSTQIEVVSDRIVVFRYEAAKRLTDERNTNGQDGHRHRLAFPFPVPEAPDLEDGSFRIAREITFGIVTPPRGVITWLAIVDAETGALLYLRSFSADISGLVFTRDPLTAGGTAGPDAVAGTLNGFRTSVMLPGLAAPAPGAEQSLAGDTIAVQDFELTTAVPPTEAVGTNFDYPSRTNDFAAVNAYYHNDRFFRLVADLGFDRSDYFDGTTFPLLVDHRGRYGSIDGIEINASCSGNGTGGIANVDYELAHLADTTNPIGLANDWRVVLHELGGHGILYDHVNAANFGFSHSAGDSFAAILNDPDTLAADRFLTFPWVAAVIGRRHDRAVGAGWAWGGSMDDAGYQSEEILCTTHFRIYRSLGGDSASVDMRRFAARVVAHLMLGAVGTLFPWTNPSNASGWVNALLAADTADWPMEGLAGGAYGKVIRWAFEKQGLFQAPGAPTPVTTEGQPPAQDVYIDDGRNGEYQFQPVHWDNQNVWNRRSADAGTLHQDPWLNQTNYAYCRVRNRGTQTATGVVVKAYHTDPGAGLTWPDDWVAMTTAQLSAPDIPSGGDVVVGPFSWTPTTADHECLLMIASASGDPSNVDAFGPGESIPEWRLVPHDNNIGQRNVHPVPAGTNLLDDILDLIDDLVGLSFTVHNPFDRRVKVMLDITLPPLLVEKGWQARAASAGGNSFGLAAGGARRVRLAVTPGQEISAAEIKAAASRDVVVAVHADGILIGGMTYRLDPNHEVATPRDDTHGDKRESQHDCAASAEHLLRCLDLPDDRVSSVKLRRVGVDIELDDRCP